MSDHTIRTPRKMLLQMRERFATLDYALLTTYNFSPGMFETNALPVLAGFSQDEIEKGTISRLLVNRQLAKTSVVVACDRSTQPKPNGQYRYRMLCVGLPEGRFHPKIVLLGGTLLDGRQGAVVGVSSANITFSGWALNREVCVCAEIKSSQPRDEMLKLIVWLQAQTKNPSDSTEDADTFLETHQMLELARRGLSALHLTNTDDMASDLHISIPGNNIPEEAIIDRIAGTKSWKQCWIFSPYWGSLESDLPRLRASEKNLVLTKNQQGQFEISLPPKLQDLHIKLFENSWLKEHLPFTHAKVYIFRNEGSEDRVAVGSANCTGAGLGIDGDSDCARNVEAMLVCTLKREISQALLKETSGITEEIVRLNAANPGQNGGPPPVLPFDIDVTYNWKTRHVNYLFEPWRVGAIQYACMQVGDAPEVSLGTKRTSGSFDYAGLKAPRIYKVKYVLGNGEENVFFGVVYQIAATECELGYRTRPNLRDLLAVYKNLRFTKTKKKLPDQDLVARRIVDVLDDEAGTSDTTGTEEPDTDVFGLYQSFYNLREHLAHNQFNTTALRSATDFLANVITLAVAELRVPQVDQPRLIFYFLLLTECQDFSEWLGARGHPLDQTVLVDLGRACEGAERTVLSAVEGDEAIKRHFGEKPDLVRKRLLPWCLKQLRECWQEVAV